MKTIIALFTILFLSLTFTASDAVAFLNDGEIARAVFASNVEDREPVDNLESLEEGLERVYFFTDLRNFEGHTVTHRWYYNGEKDFEMNFDVGGPRWRTWSSKALTEHHTGTWRVDVIADETVIDSFEISR